MDRWAEGGIQEWADVGEEIEVESAMGRKVRKKPIARTGKRKIRKPREMSGFASRGVYCFMSARMHVGKKTDHVQLSIVKSFGYLAADLKIRTL